MSIDLAAARQELRYTSTNKDALITRYLNAAIAWVENYTHKKLTRGEVTQELSTFTDYLELFWGPDPADLTISYFDSGDDEQEFDTARIVRHFAWPPINGVWPTIAENSVITLTYTAGYATTPADLDMAVLLYIRQMYDHGVITDAGMTALESLCAPYRVPTVR